MYLGQPSPASKDDGAAHYLHISGGCDCVGGLESSQEEQGSASDEGNTARLGNPRKEGGTEQLDMGQLRDPREGRRNTRRGEATEETA